MFLHFIILYYWGRRVVMSMINLENREKYHFFIITILIILLEMSRMIQSLYWIHHILL